MVKGYWPTSLEEAIKIYSEEECILYAGGTDLMVMGNTDISYLYLNGIDELKEIKIETDSIFIGSGVTFSDAINDGRIPLPLRQAAASVASPAIRNSATFGGNIANGSDKADTVPVEFALDAKVHLISKSGERVVDIDKFHISRKNLDIREGEIITGITIPVNGSEKYYFQKVGGRNSMAVSFITFAGLFEEENGVIKRVSTSFGSVSDAIVRFRNIENLLIGKSIAEAKLMKDDIISKYNEALVTVDGRVSKEYCRIVCINLLRDFLQETVGL